MQFDFIDLRFQTGQTALSLSAVISIDPFFFSMPLLETFDRKKKINQIKSRGKRFYSADSINLEVKSWNRAVGLEWAQNQHPRSANEVKQSMREK